VIATTSTGSAIVQAAVERRVGDPVYLRYAAEVRDAGDLIAHAAGAVAFAAQALGEPTEIYAVGLFPGDDPAGPPAYVSLTVRHPDGAVALIGIGRAAQPEPGAPPVGRPGDLSGAPAVAVPASLLLLGDRGVVERYPGPAGEVAPLAGVAAADAASQADADALARYAAAIRRALAGGAAERVEAQSGS
jgi:hypothetical protein